MHLAMALPEREAEGAKYAEWLQQTKDGAAGALVKISVARNPALSGAIFDDILAELLQRIRDGDTISGEKRISLGQELQEKLAEGLEVHGNRFSTTRLRDLFWTFYSQLAQKPPIQGASILDLGSGSHNPFGLLFIFVMLGARKGSAIDLEIMQDPPRAFRAMARSAEVMLVEPSRIVGNYPISRAQIEQNLSSFDLTALREGKSSGIDLSRLNFQRDSAAQISIESSSIDIIMSNSFLEHVDDLEAIIGEMARVTIPGGVSIHAIDTIDHTSYGDPSCHPLQFLRVSKPGMINGCNRIRILEFPALFERHGFEIQQVIPIKKIEVDDTMRQSFAPAWRTMPQNFLEVVQGLIVSRRI